MSNAKNLNSAIETISVHSPDTSIFTLLGSSDIVSKLVMLILFFASIWTIAIVINKLMRISSITKKISNFENSFWSGAILDQLYETVKNKVNDPMTAIFVAAICECKKQNTKNLSYELKENHKYRINSSMQIVRNREMESLEKNLGVLSAIASTSPFIALFGTIWGIVNSFQAIGISKNTSLAVVGPGIAEALIVTGIGLVVVVQAMLLHHYLLSKTININNKLDEFMSELELIISRAIDEEKL
jgi:biopolymer transport protein TolQ